MPFWKSCGARQEHSGQERGDGLIWPELEGKSACIIYGPLWLGGLGKFRSAAKVGGSSRACDRAAPRGAGKPLNCLEGSQSPQIDPHCYLRQCHSPGNELCSGLHSVHPKPLQMFQLPAPRLGTQSLPRLLHHPSPSQMFSTWRWLSSTL